MSEPDTTNVFFLGEATQSSRKAAWLDQVAQAWDRFVDKYDHEPDAMFYVQLGSEGVMSSWMIEGPYKDVTAAAAVLVVAEHLRRESYEPT